MKRLQKILCVAGVSLLIAVVNPGCSAKNPAKTLENNVEKETEGKNPWQDTFTVDKKNLGNVGENDFFSLIPGAILHFKNGQDTLTITVLNETKLVDGVETRIIEEKETAKGQVAEISRNYFALDKLTKAVYYFGEAVDIYKEGKVSGHEGGWEAGKENARFGLMMPGKPKVGEKYYQEVAPRIAMDRAEVISLSEKMTVPAGTYEKCLKILESSPLEKGTGAKLYAPGVGLVKDDEFVLVKIENQK